MTGIRTSDLSITSHKSHPYTTYLKLVLNNVALPSFSSISFYYHTCKQLNILPLIFRFKLKDLIFFHSIFYKKSVVKLPSYLTLFEGSRLRHCHLDSLSICSSVLPRSFLKKCVCNVQHSISLLHAFFLDTGFIQ